MSKVFLQVASVFLLLAVILGAFGAHSLEDKISAAQIDTFETGVRYQFYHSFALLLIGVLLRMDFPKQLIWAAYSFILGIIFFSTSIYLLACRDMLGIADWWWLGPITPIGGTFFIIGWVLFFIGVSKE